MVGAQAQRDAEIRQRHRLVLGIARAPEQAPDARGLAECTHRRVQVLDRAAVLVTMEQGITEVVEVQASIR